MVPVVSWRIFSEYHILGPYPPPCRNWPLQYYPTNMCTALAVTTSAELDPTLSDDAAIVTRICKLIATWDNGTPLDPTPFGEEHAIEMCISLGQEHLEGVLWASDTETVIAFSSDLSMMAAMQCFAAVTTLHDKLIWLCIWPPQLCRSGTTLLPWLAALWYYSSACQGEEVETQPSSSKPWPHDEPLLDLTWDIRELCLDQLWEVFRALHVEIARREGHTSPGIIPG